MQNNIYIVLDLFLDPANIDAAALREELDTKIKQWKNSSRRDALKGEVAKVEEWKKKIASIDLQLQAKEAHKDKLSELQRQVALAKKVGVVEEQTKNIINAFKKYFLETTILHELGVQTQETDTGFPPKPPKSLLELQCKKPVSYREMAEIAKDLEHVEKRTLYELLKLPQNAELSKLQAAVKTEADRIHKMPKGQFEADVLNRLSAKFIYFKDTENRKNYDYALKRYPFNKFCEEELNIYALGFAKQKKTDWKTYQEAIQKTKLLGYTQAEADYLVYEYFVLEKKCLAPVPGKIERPPDTVFGLDQTALNVDPFGAGIGNLLKDIMRG